MTDEQLAREYERLIKFHTQLAGWEAVYYFAKKRVKLLRKKNHEWKKKPVEKQQKSKYSNPHQIFDDEGY